MKLSTPLRRDTRWVLFALAILATGCASTPTVPERLGVTVRMLNYTDRELQYMAIADPTVIDNSSGGVALNPYGSSGAICCYGLPPAWRPGLQAVIAYKFYGEDGDTFPPGRNHPSMRGGGIQVFKRLLAIPPYDPATLSNVWVIMHADRSVEVIVSDVGPSHPEWTGRVKGNPVPSREYRLKLWQEAVNRERSALSSWERDSPEDPVYRQDSWTLLTKYGRKEIETYSGPDDPEFIRYLRDRHERNLQHTRNVLDLLEKQRP